MRHEGYLGAVGAFLKGAEEEESSVFYPLGTWAYVFLSTVVDLGSWTENLASSSGFYDQPVARAPSPVPVRPDIVFSLSCVQCVDFRSTVSLSWIEWN